MKIAVTAVRMLMGLLFLFASITFLFQLFPKPELTGDMKTFNAGLEASGYLMYLIKVIELVCGIALVSGRFVPLAAVLLAPISVNILCVHLFLAPEGLPVAIFVVLGNLFLAYTYREVYAPLFAAK
ncbi:MAG: DoxX family membrane protein [Candidatus Latescibacteria bacterium]|nr:DoxX family membrane protein [Candidatus Latescibacterota bacterium]